MDNGGITLTPEQLERLRAGDLSVLPPAALEPPKMLEVSEKDWAALQDQVSKLKARVMELERINRVEMDEHKREYDELLKFVGRRQ